MKILIELFMCAYASKKEDNEIEARWMELQPKQYVIDSLRKYCMERPQDR